MCDLVRGVAPEGTTVHFRHGTVYRVVSNEEFHRGVDGSAVAPSGGEDVVYVFPSPSLEADGDVLYCRHPDEENGDWEVVEWPHGDEAVAVPVGAELKLVLANPGVEFAGMV